MMNTSMSGQHGTDGSCCGHTTSDQQTLTQTIKEMDFSRGLWGAAVNSDMERVVKLLSDGTNPNIPDTSGYSPLHYACRHGNEEICRILIKGGANVNAKTHGGVTPLHRAAYCRHVTIVTMLLRNGADPSLADADGKNSLHKALEGGDPVIIELIKNHSPSLTASSVTNDK